MEKSRTSGHAPGRTTSPSLPYIYITLHLLYASVVCVPWTVRAFADDDCTPVTWYQDQDQDGYGNPMVSITTCTPPVGFVANNGDCNDDPQARGTLFHPGAKEPCNYDDYDCDGTVRTCVSAPEGNILPLQRDEFVVTSFEKGHSFKAVPEGNHNLNDASDVFPGEGLKQSALIQSNSDGVTTVLRAKAIGPYDFSQHMPKVWIKLENATRIKDLSFYMGNQNFANYARFNLNSRQGQRWITEGDWVAFSLPWNESDFAQLRLSPGVSLESLRKNITDFQFRIVDDHTGPVKLHVNRISAIREPREKYPHGVISFTFDDNWESQFTQARPKLDQYNFAATAYVIVGFLDVPNYMTTAELRELQDASRWEVSLHAFDPVMHLQAYTSFPPEMVERDILAGRQWLWENGFGAGADGKHGIAHFAYPKGEFLQPGFTDVLSIVRRHFSSARTINERQRETVPPSDAHKLRVLYVTAPETVESVKAKIEKGIEAGEWIILVLHDLVENPQQNDQWEISKFGELVDYLGTRVPAVPVRTIGDVLGDLPGK